MEVFHPLHGGWSPPSLLGLVFFSTFFFFNLLLPILYLVDGILDLHV